jgi:hypothetical protein
MIYQSLTLPVPVLLAIFSTYLYGKWFITYVLRVAINLHGGVSPARARRLAGQSARLELYLAALRQLRLRQMRLQRPPRCSLES